MYIRICIYVIYSIQNHIPHTPVYLINEYDYRIGQVDLVIWQ